MTANAGFGSGLTLILAIVIGLFFLYMLVVFGMAAFGGLAEWARNNKQPVVSLPVTVVAKRTSVSRGSEPGLSQIASTNFFVTFELPDGDRKEFLLTRTESDAISEGDQGAITMQGTRFKGFTRS